MLKQLALSLAESPWFVRALASAGSSSCTAVFMHRFAANREHEGRHDPNRLRRVLGELRRAGIALVGLEEAVSYTSEGQGQHRKLAVSFTVDDGYADFAELGWPVFKEFDCPVSLFVVPGVINGDTWFWWDRLDWIMRHGNRSCVELKAGDERFVAGWSDNATRHQVFEQACHWLKQWPTVMSEQALSNYAQLVSVTVPVQAPEQYRVLSWPELQRLEQEGVRIGAHTMTHPVLSRCSDERARWEVVESVRAVREQIRQPLPVFCYPNGQPADHGVREWQLMQEATIPYAMTTTGGVLRSALSQRGDSAWRYRLPRIGFQLRAGQILREFLT